jgi:SAM-dependent methyltransferase
MDSALPPLKVRLPKNELRSEARVREHYAIERKLADRLRQSTPEDRRTLYASACDELFSRVPDHPMLRVKQSSSGRDVTWDLRLLSRFLRDDTVFMEIGPGDCAVSIRVAERAKQVYAVDVSTEITKNVHFPKNLRLCLSDGISVPVPQQSVHLAYSAELMEHLHPDDAAEQLRNIYRALAPGGVYVCVTPNRISGPHDISRYFDEVSTGFHLREYSCGELNRLLREVGFSKVLFYVGARGWYLRCPTVCTSALELGLEHLPRSARKRLASTKVAHALLGVRLAAFK